MKLEITRAFFCTFALASVGTAVAAWHEPGMRVLSLSRQCPLPVAQALPSASADQANLLLLVIGLQQGLRPSS